MSEMIERVAKAIRRRSIDLKGYTPAPDHMLDFGPVEMALAKAAIEAIREPTPEMVKRGVDHRLTTTIGSENVWPVDTATLYRAMIDAALK